MHLLFCCAAYLELLKDVAALLAGADVRNDAAHLGDHRLHHAQLIIIPLLRFAYYQLK